MKLSRALLVALAAGVAATGLAVSPAYASDTYTSSKNCAETYTPRSYTPLTSSSGPDRIRHTWTGSGGSTVYGWTGSAVWNRSTSYLKGRNGTVSAHTETKGVFHDSSATMTCVSNPV